MMTLTSFSIWIELGLMATFVVLVASLLLGFYMKSSHKSDSPLDNKPQTSLLWKIFRRNKRRGDRVPCDVEVELRDRTDYVRTGSGRLLNLSTTGACFVSLVALSLGEYVQGWLRPADQESIRFTGRVIWRRPAAGRIYYGVQFR